MPRSSCSESDLRSPQLTAGSVLWSPQRGVMPGVVSGRCGRGSRHCSPSAGQCCTTSGADGSSKSDRLDLTELPDPSRHGTRSIGSIGHLHLVQRTRDELEDVFLGMGFAIADRTRGRDRLVQLRGSQHPAGSSGARDVGHLLPRRGRARHGSASRRTRRRFQIRLMQSQDPPVYAVMPGTLLPPRHA